MMYNRYIPGTNGVYKKHSIHIPDPVPETEHTEVAKPCEPERHKTCSQQTWEPRGWELGDVLLLCIAALLLIDSEDGDILPIVIAAAAYLFLQ